MSIYGQRFVGRSAVVTGGASGLGRAVALRIVAEGGSVVLWDNDAGRLAHTAAEIGVEGSLVVDVADAGAVTRATAETMAVLGKLDILIASAGITGATAALHEFPVESWRNVIDVNLNGLFYCCRALVPMMLANGYGRIVNVSSVAGKEGNPCASALSLIHI